MVDISFVNWRKNPCFPIYECMSKDNRNFGVHITWKWRINKISSSFAIKMHLSAVKWWKYWLRPLAKRLSKNQKFMWYKRFQDGLEDAKDDTRSGRRAHQFIMEQLEKSNKSCWRIARSLSHYHRSYDSYQAIFTVLSWAWDEWRTDVADPLMWSNCALPSKFQNSCYFFDAMHKKAGWPNHRITEIEAYFWLDANLRFKKKIESKLTFRIVYTPRGPFQYLR